MKNLKSTSESNNDLLNNVFKSAKDLLKDKKYVGNIKLFLMRYRTKTDLKRGKIEFPSFYNPNIDSDIQESFLKNFTNSEESFISESPVDYSVNGGAVDGVSFVSKNVYDNVQEFTNKLDSQTDLKKDLRKISIASLKCYIVKISLPDDKIVYYFGSIKNYSKLQNKTIFTRVHSELNDSSLKSFDLNSTIGFSLDISVIYFNDKLYILNTNKFESYFQMSQFYKEKAKEIIDNPTIQNKINPQTLCAMEKFSNKDSRVAKMIMKLKFRNDRVKALLENINDENFKEIIKDNKIFQKQYENVHYEKGFLTVKDPDDRAQIRELVKFIADTAHLGALSHRSIVEQY